VRYKVECVAFAAAAVATESKPAAWLLIAADVDADRIAIGKHAVWHLRMRNQAAINLQVMFLANQ